MKITIKLDLDWEKDLIESRTGQHMKWEIETALLSLANSYGFQEPSAQDGTLVLDTALFDPAAQACDPEDEEFDLCCCALANMLDEVKDLEDHYNTDKAIHEANKELEYRDAGTLADLEASYE